MFALVLLLVVSGLVAAAYDAYRARPLSLVNTPLRFKVEKGAGLAQISGAMQASGLQLAAWQLSLAMRLRGDSHRIKAGVYELAQAVTLKALLDMMVRGDSVLAQLRVIEGWDFRKFRAQVNAHPELLHDSADLTDEQLLRRIGADETKPEGLFFPNTYRFAPGSSDLDVYRQAYRLMKAAVDAAWETRQEDLPIKSPYEALVLASIVEKETGREDERAKVAAVFVNRLRIGMPLQSDPTTIYGMGERFDGNLRKRDLQTDTPYNTYTRRGLPPTPISLPGRASLLAVMQPEPIKALFFVSRGDGSSEFSDDLNGHNRAVARYQLKRKP
jgi:UPF0755 protein